MRNRMFAHRGFSMIEMLVSTVIFMFLAFGVYFLFDRGQWMYLHAERRTNMQENGRLAMETMERDMRMIALGVPKGTQVVPSGNPGEDTWLPDVFAASVNQIGFRGDVDSRNALLRLDAATGSTVITVHNANRDYACPQDGSKMILVSKGRSWQGFECDPGPGVGEITLDSGVDDDFLAAESEVFSPEHVFYRITPDSNNDGVCDISGATPTDYSVCLLQRSVETTAAPITVANNWETLATNISRLRFDYFETDDPPQQLTTLPLAGQDLYRVDLIRITLEATERNIEVQKTQSKMFTSDIFIRKRKLS